METLPGNAFSWSCDSGANGGRAGVGETSGIILTSPGRFVEYGSRITFIDVHLNVRMRFIKEKNKKQEQNREREKKNKTEHLVEFVKFSIGTQTNDDFCVCCVYIFERKFN